MPKGDNPNSRKNLIRPDTAKAREMQKKSVKAKKRNASIKEAIWNLTDPDEVAEVIVTGAIKHRNTKYMDMLLEITGEKAAKKQEVEVSTRSPFAHLSDEELKELISGD